MRTDGRSADQIRRPRVQWDVAQRADGSVSWQQGSSQVQAAVFGPVQGPAWLADPEQASVQVIWSGRGGMAEAGDRAAEMQIKGLVEGMILGALMPRCLIRVSIQVVTSDGSELACAINATSLALVHAAIPLKTMFVAACCCMRPDASFLLDPTRLEEQEAVGTATAAYASSMEKDVTVPAAKSGLQLVESEGTMTFSEQLQLQQLCQLSCMQAAALVHQFVQQLHHQT